MAAQAHTAELVPVHEWLSADDIVIGCGSALELWYWKREGVNQSSDRLGDVIGHEPASEDRRRATAWDLDAADFPDWHPLVRTRSAPLMPISMTHAIAAELPAA